MRRALKPGGLDILGVFQPLMDGRIPRSGGRSVSGGNRVGVVFDEAPEMAAFRRWQNQEFYEVEPRGRCTARRDTVQMWQVQV